MPQLDLYTYATTTLGMSPAELAAEGVFPGSQTVEVPDPGIPSAAATNLSVTNQSSVQAILTATLKLFGIDGPEALQYAQQFLIDHPSVSEAGAQAQLQLDLQDPSTGIGGVVDRMYPAIRQRREAGLPPISIGSYIGLREQYTQDLTRAGLTPYVDPKSFADARIAADTSPAEVQDRISAAQKAVFNEPPEVRAEMQRMFGVGDALGAATAYYLDPTNTVPKIQQQLQAGEIGGAARRTGYGLLTAEEATQLAQLGVTGDQAQQGFTDLGKQGEVFGVLPGETGSAVDRATQIGAEFGGNVAAQQEIERRRRARLAVFGSAAGGWNAGQRGTSGLGSAAG